MNYQEKTILIALPLDFIIFGAYGIWLIPQLSEGIVNIDYRTPVILALVASVLLTIISQILLASFDHKQANVEDVRDKEIRRRANGYTLAFLAAPYLFGLILAIAEADYFYIVHVMLFGGVLADIVTSLAQLRFYRRGIN